MATRYLPDADHIIRLVKPSLVMRDENREVIGCFPGAFKLREGNGALEGEKNLSVSWLEFFPGSKSKRLQQVRDHTELKVRPNHGFAGINVGDLRQACASVSVNVRVIHEPTKGNHAHAAIHRYPRDHDELFGILANMASRDLTLASDIPTTELPK
jgi:hypothetical protein